jgi:hypothetical protein
MQEEGDLQVLAGISLITSTGLVQWDSARHVFAKGDELEDFNKRWESINPAFGRVILWHTFATGAEYFLKGVLLLNGKEVRFVEDDKKKQKLVFPPTDPASLTTWASHFFNSPPTAPKSEAISFGDLGSIVGDTAKFRYLGELHRTAAPSDETADAQMQFAYAAMNLLRDSIRNRDAHAYIPNVRNGNFHLVEPLYLPAFNILLSWIPVAHQGEELSARLAMPDVHVRAAQPTRRITR